MPGYWNLKSDIEVKNEITNQLSINSLDFIGRYWKHPNGFTFFDNIRLPNFSPLPKIKSNKDDKLANTKVILQRVQRIDLKNGSYYHFTCKVISQNLRVKHNNEFIFIVENDSEIKEYKPVAKNFIDSIYDRFDKADSANNNDISKALNTITYQINKKPETFIYELLQNADDNAGNKDVNVTFFITDKYLLVFHNGEPFKFNNVFAICSVNAEDKSDDIAKIGFKGIGFKSVFKDNDWVFINSGEYSFRFDQSKYSVEKPWQLMPIWTPIDEELDISIRKNDRFLSENVSIALRPMDNDVKLLSKYSKTLELFNDDRILLFLKKVRQVHVSLQNKEKIHCRKNNAIWGIRDYTITVNKEVKTWLNEQIRNNNQEVPIKYQDIDKFKISYAYKVDNGKVIPLVDSTLFNYLPLSISLGFPFLVNSDFIPDGDREELYLNAWNEYLMIEIGRNLPIFISDLVSQKVDSFHLLPESAKNNFLNSKWNQLYEWFLQGYVDSLKGENPIAFIPTKLGSLETLSNILIDETGLAKLLGDEFTQLTGITEKLIDNNVGEGINKIKALLKEYDLSNNIYTVEKLKSELENDIFQKWLKNPINNFNFLEFVFSSLNAELKAIVDTEKIILTEAGELSKAEDIYSSIPNEISFISNNRLNLQLKEHLDKSIVKLRTIEFHATNFLISNREKVNTLLSKEIDILNFWYFVYDYWKELKESDDVKKSLRKFYVICKSTKEGELITKEVAATYLSKEIAVEDEVESIIESLKLEDKYFINPVFINNGNRGNITTWLEIFKGAKRGLSDLINELIFQLEELKDDTLHFKACYEIFKYWNKNKNIQEKQLSAVQIAKLKQHLKIKCIDDLYRASSESIISEHYQTNKIIDSFLLEISLSNQISSDYSDTQIIEWNTFFKNIGCISLEEKQQVLNAKLSHTVTHQDKLDEEQRFSILKSISDLQKLKKENGLIFDYENTISQIKLLTSKDEWHFPHSIHLSNAYQPKLSLQNDESINSTIHFLNEKYLPNEIEKNFLTEIGVHSNFNISKVESQLLSDLMELDYKKHIENDSKYIADRNGLLKNWNYKYTISSVTYVLNHFNINYYRLLSNPNYYDNFIEFISKKKNYDFLTLKTDLSIWKDRRFPQNTFIYFVINSYENFVTVAETRDKPINLYSKQLAKYITNKSKIPKLDLSGILLTDDGLSLEEAIGIRQELSTKHILSLLSDDSITLSEQEIKDLNIGEILRKSNLDPEEIKNAKLPNTLFQWKPINELFVTNDSKMNINAEQHLHNIFLDLANDFGVKKLSEENLILKTNPKTPTVADEIELFFKNKAKFIAFKIDHLNYEEVEAMIIEKINKIVFYEVTSISKVFPEVRPVYKTEIAFHFEVDENKIFYNDNWKTNSELKLYIHKHILDEKIPEAWFENVVNRWDEKELIELLKGEYGRTPFVTKEGIIDNEKILWDEYSEDEATYIKSIVNINYNQEGQLDANTTAKIKTLMLIKGDYGNSPISDEGRYLKAGNNEILVRSAQKGLLYLDLFHWERLTEEHVKIAVYTNSQINIFNSQEDLFQYCKPQNKFGVLRMPDDYNLDDYNSLDNIFDKGKWHFVFIVNGDAKAAKQYKEIIDLDEYNNYG